MMILNDSFCQLTNLAQTTNSNRHNNSGIRNVHVAASDIDGQLLLLHQIRDGAASSSFGLHVAKMAGIPSAVLADAQRYLTENLTPVPTLTDDKTDLAKSGNDKRPPYAYDNVASTTADTSVESNVSHYNNQQNKQQKQMLSVYDELNNIDPDSLTPRQAHDLLYTLKQFINP